MIEDATYLGKSTGLSRQHSSKASSQRFVDDFVDRLHHGVSTVILLMGMCLVMFKQYLLAPLTCYLSTDNAGVRLGDNRDQNDWRIEKDTGNIGYVENYCFVQGTIPISHNISIPTTNEGWRQLDATKRTKYYQWVPLMLGIQALMFYLPHLLWKLLNSDSRSNDIKKMVKQAKEATRTDGSTRKDHVLRLTKTLESILFENSATSRRGAHGWLSRFSESVHLSRRNGIQMYNFYIIIKLLYIANVVCQLFIMNQFLSLDRHEKSFLGYGVMRDILSGKDWKETLVFPRVAYCLIPLRTMAGTVYTVAQCALPVNMLNEKIYVFLWIFFTLLLILTTFSFIKLIILRLYQSRETSMIARYLRLNEAFKEKTESKRQLKNFHDLFLRHNGIFLLNILAKESGDLITGEIVRQMWEKFKDEKYQFDEDTIKTLCKVKHNKKSQKELGSMLLMENLQTKSAQDCNDYALVKNV